MSITITAEGMDAAVRRMQRTLTALSGQETLTVLARALNRGLQSARAEALRIGRTTFSSRCGPDVPAVAILKRRLKFAAAPA